MKRVGVGFVLILIGLVAGCDDTPAVPQAVLEQSNQPKIPIRKRPTTQDLLSPTRKQIVLGALPLTMRVPESWGIEIMGGATLLRGFLPSGGDVDLQLTARPGIKLEDLDRLVTGAKKELAAKPDSIIKADLRDLGAAKLMERQSIGASATLTTYDDKEHPVTRTESTFKWTLNVYLPSAGAFQVYEVNMIGLTKNQYDLDKEFLHGILGTLSLGGPTTAPSLAAPTTPTTLP